MFANSQYKNYQGRNFAIFSLICNEVIILDYYVLLKQLLMFKERIFYEDGSPGSPDNPWGYFKASPRVLSAHIAWNVSTNAFHNVFLGKTGLATLAKLPIEVQRRLLKMQSDVAKYFLSFCPFEQWSIHSLCHRKKFRTCGWNIFSCWLVSKGSSFPFSLHDRWGWGNVQTVWKFHS